MSWHFLQGQAGDYSQADSLDGTRFAPSKSKTTTGESSSGGKLIGHLTTSPSGTTFVPSTANLGGGQLTLSLGASPAKTLAPQHDAMVGAQDLPETVRDFGTRCSESLTRSGLALSSRKTRRVCVPLDLAPSSKDLPAWGMTADGACWELGTSARLTSGTGCGLLPTPTTQGNELSPSMQKWPAHRRLAEYLATPAASSYGYQMGGAAGRRGKKRYCPSKEVENVGLCPLAFREWMMGWPIGWTALEPLATGRFRKWLRSHGEF